MEFAVYTNLYIGLHLIHDSTGSLESTTQNSIAAEIEMTATRVRSGPQSKWGPIAESGGGTKLYGCE